MNDEPLLRMQFSLESVSQRVPGCLILHAFQF